VSPWGPGRLEVDELLTRGHLRRLRGASHGVASLMDRARQQLASAHSLLDTDPGTAYVVAYDGAKHAGMALLAEQDLRPTPEGGHGAIEKALAAQFKGVFQRHGSLRRRRNELDYPTSGDDFTNPTETTKALATVTDIVEAARKVLDAGALTIY
jgi:hypothetical protein